MNAPDFRADLNGLRGLSVALVVAFHLQLKGAGGGFVGVDVFFVLSGYLMTRIVCQGLAAGSFSYGRFLLARAARIWPALGALVLGLLLAGLWVLPPFDLQILGEQSVRALLFISNHYFLARSGYITHAGDTHWLLHTWSLAVEWQFYMLYPLLLMALARLAPAARRDALLLAGVTLVLLLSLGLSLVLGRNGSEQAFFLLPARAWELCAGGVVFLAGRWPQFNPRGAWRPVASHAGVALLLASLLLLAFMRVRSASAGPWLLLPVAATLLVLWADHPSNLLLRNPLLQRLGLWSYSIYLWHWPLIVGLRMTDFPLDHPVPAAAAVAVMSVVLGALSHALVERGWRQPAGLPAWRRARKPVFALLAAGGLGAVVVSTGGAGIARACGQLLPGLCRGRA